MTTLIDIARYSQRVRLCMGLRNPVLSVGGILENEKKLPIVASFRTSERSFSAGVLSTKNGLALTLRYTLTIPDFPLGGVGSVRQSLGPHHPDQRPTTRKLARTKCSRNRKQHRSTGRYDSGQGEHA